MYIYQRLGIMRNFHVWNLLEIRVGLIFLNNMATVGLLLIITTCVFIVESAPTVTSKWGTAEGVLMTSPEGKQYEAFRGIPYAVPPVGELRYQKPKAHPGPTGTFIADSYGPACPQIRNVTQSEDCLTLNVFRPEVVVSKLPVMVWIHGGGFYVGSASMYEPWKMVTEGNVIIVTIQYRLGVLGFLSTGSPDLPGNYGLWDMTLALQWVKDNVESYGGNASDVTIFGESAGAKALSYLILSEKSKDLYHKAIMQSGSATSYFSFRAHPRQVAVSLASRLQCQTSGLQNQNPTDKDLVDCFKNTSVSTLVKHSEPHIDLAYYSADFTWSPVVDYDFLIDSPRNLFHNVTHLEHVNFYDEDLMVGVNNEEGGYMLGRVSKYGSTYHVDATNVMKTQTFYKTKLIPLILNRLCDGFENSSVDLIAKTYFPGKIPPTQILDPNEVIRTQSDASIVAPSVEVARAHARGKGRAKTYFYYFDHYPSFLANTSGLKGMIHGRDLVYSFWMSPDYMKSHFHTDADAAEMKLSKTFVAMYTNFATKSDPNDAVRADLSRDWPQYDVTDEKYLSLSTHMSIDSHFLSKRVSVWLDDLPLSDPHCRVQSSLDTATSLVG